MCTGENIHAHLTTHKEIHVSKQGNDQHPGTMTKPLLSINAASLIAQPGDKIIIHKGTYREQIYLSKGGNAEASRIVYQAAKGEKVCIKGSEKWSRWTKNSKGYWVAEVDNKWFGAVNPFGSKDFSGKEKQATASIYINGNSLRQCVSVNELVLKKMSWISLQQSGKTLLLANFGDLDPVKSLTEISVRPFAIEGMVGANFITIHGLTISQIANAEGTVDGLHTGAISTNGGTHWIIEDCTVNYCNTIGIAIGQTGHEYLNGNPRQPMYSDLSTPLATVGHHVVRRNHISRCGQAAIFGLLHGSGTEIRDNLIEDINAESNFAGEEIAGIRLAVAIDVIVSHNLIRRVNSGYGIFLGPLFQGARISKNIITATAGCIYLYNNHGPVMIDNNIFTSTNRTKGIEMMMSEANVFVQNLFIDCELKNEKNTGISVATANYLPHSLTIKQTIPSLNIDHRFYGNLFIRKGLDQVPATSGSLADFNVYLAGAKAAIWEGVSSIVLSIDPRLKLVNTQLSINLEKNLNRIPLVDCPKLNAAFIGFFALSKQFLEQPDGHALIVDQDFLGKTSALPKSAGPFYNLANHQIFKLFNLKAQ